MNHNLMSMALFKHQRNIEVLWSPTTGITSKFIVILLLFLSALPFFAGEKTNNPFGLVIHGGAGKITKEKMTPEKEKAYTKKLQEALDAGYAILESGGTSLDTVEMVIRILENSPLFNAGKGAVFTYDEKNELDASIMDGETLNAGAVSGISGIKNPITLARAIMEQSPHVMLSGEGALEFARTKGLEIVPLEYFKTEKRLNALRKMKSADQEKDPDKKHGTVGAVALDKHGNLAGGTSTGGMTGKRYGRIGDSPVIGAGTYANNKTCAVSATGHGEYFIRSVVAYDISALMEYKGLSLVEAADEVIQKKLVKLGGTGGIIAIDALGNTTMSFNTPGMYRGCRMSTGLCQVLFYDTTK